MTTSKNIQAFISWTKRLCYLLHTQGAYSDPHWDFFKEKAANGSFEAHFSHPVEIFDMNKGLARHFLSQEQIDSKSWLSQALQVRAPASPSTRLLASTEPT